MAPSTLVIGSTGLTGSYILSNLLAGGSESAVYTIGRRAPKSTGPKLNAIIEGDTTQWASRLRAITPAPTTVISALGTTRVQAGGIANQWKIDHDLNVELARTAKEAGVKNFVFVSSGGTTGMLANRVPYSQMKQGVEKTVRELGFQTAIILRPGFIMGQRETERMGEGLAVGAVRGLGRLLGLGFQDKFAQDAEVIGRAAVHAVRLTEEGKAPSPVWILEQADIVRLGRDEWKE
ncbi:protein FMP52, mitochondrial [Podospora australis]|uniref:Protein FMP52, mitochondrial n=1 Tax=Podospora australis TaxID=1536484 RepID=A0AAN7AFP7_9PEZI|nr:protein FMP52, mitochondrial [Podospora australis]